MRERCEGMQRSSVRFREDSGSTKGRERIRDLRDQGRECRGGERVNSAKEKGAVIIEGVVEKEKKRWRRWKSPCIRLLYSSTS